jgi:hypothetical protein
MDQLKEEKTGEEEEQLLQTLFHQALVLLKQSD